MFFLYLAGVAYLAARFFGSVEKEDNNLPVHNTWLDFTTTWVEQGVLTWWVFTWSLMPKSPRGYVDYTLKNWKAWEDFVVIVPDQQPIIRSSEKEENNEVMFTYLWENVSKVKVPDWVTGWYIMFTTKHEISDNRDLFLWIDWLSKGAIYKNRSLDVYNMNEYLYDLTSVPLAEFPYAPNLLKEFVRDWYLYISSFVWERWNSVEKITIVFK